MPLQSVELVLDAVTDEAVRGLWAALAQAGLPSQADHQGPTNAPHVTLAAVPLVTAAAEQALVPLAARLPMRLELTGPALLGERRPALVLPVAPDAALDALHRHVRSALVETVGMVDELPWRPHITLARRLPDDVATAALAYAASLPIPSAAVATAVRRWDPELRRAWLVG
ncbi:2'-5' RNA ligase family protein [Phycicoccus sp. M110.8]|uniref:2'-5' RNA ligase family protein n=1 Tax=Phycicoccus sp. M110.8 TaxID=3075433 RepID=UPI0028FCFCA7|nr:2'-5' RNA ligase family protein [Phycicoccus sp. M110.8]MDU0313608.1 2'-5' RNA ligase family protein [Phycicoccus sp. M110.8]